MSNIITNGEQPITNKATSIRIKTPKGTRDFSPRMSAIKNHVFGIIRNVFEKYGAEEIDTPVFENKEILTGKYGEDSKLIYDLADQGGEHLSLRYDLTVPFARYLALNKIDSMKRYHIGKVYRRDNPAIARGRYREFYQCDFDIAGNFDPMIADVDCICVAVEILNNLNIGNFKIKVNHRKIIDGIMEICGVPFDKIRTISSSIDKLDKLPWDDVYNEMTNEKNISPTIANRIKEFVELNGDVEVFDKLRKMSNFEEISKISEGVNDMLLFDKYAKLLQIDSYLLYDMSLARGLDYYTGLIYEAVLDGSMSTTNDDINSNVGSIAAGGRYDDLVGMFDRKNRKVPCVGISIGIERIFTVMENKFNLEKKVIRTKKTQIMVASAQKGLINERLKLLNQIRNAGINAETSYKLNPKLLNQFQYCEDCTIPLCVIIGEDELTNNVVKLRTIQSRNEITVNRDSLINEIIETLSKLNI